MAASTVYHDVAPQDIMLDGVGQLFAGRKFWVAQRVPSRNRLLDDIRANGGDVVMIEKKADYLIADPFRRDCPPGSLSYDFVQKSIEQGQMQNAADHRLGPSTTEARAPGAIHRPAKGGRTAYTAEDDRLLYAWVQNARAAGHHRVKGNEIYKELEAKHPRHTWQSWRDRYVKQLQNRSPSSFNMPDNHLPSPLSDTAVKQAHPHDYTRAELDTLFNSDEWKELYAFVDIINGTEGEDSYAASWAAWAESQGNQTAQQWQQYYEKVVRPQWLCDPSWKREQVKQEVNQKYENKRSPSHSHTSPETQDGESGRPTQVEPTHVTNQKEKTPTTQASDTTTLSSSQASHQYPEGLGDQQQNGVKRLRRTDIIDKDTEQSGSSRPTKLPKHGSASPKVGAQQLNFSDHRQKPPKDPSRANSTSTSVTGTKGKQPEERFYQDVIPMLNTQNPTVDHRPNKAIQSSDSEDFPQVPRVSSPVGSNDQNAADDLLSNSPTPRASRLKASKFDVQAIFSSPSQNALVRFPSALQYIHDVRCQVNPRGSSSPSQHPESDASTTQSLQEFRRSLDHADALQTPFPRRFSPSRALSLSPAPSSSSSSSADSSDPDIPLEADEIDEFFEAQFADGFDSDFVVTALKRTRLRPGLAIRVLHAWKLGNALPNERGIWSLEDDEAVESGDGAALAMMQRKHTMDGWGGITERLAFLEAHRSR